MSPLPQRKKSAEELAKLREDLGIPDQAPPPPDLANRLPPVPPLAGEKAPAKEKKDPLPAGPALETGEEPSPAISPKPVRSLRKSERLPSGTRPPTRKPDSALPVKRHSGEDLDEIRRREALARLSQPQPPPFIALLAHPAIPAAGYVFALIGAVCAWRDLPIAWMLAFEILALAIAAFIFLKKTLSRHHAGFIAILAVFIVIFSVLHYFPQLQNAP